jgi:hypothetical protein
MYMERNSGDDRTDIRLSDIRGDAQDILKTEVRKTESETAFKSDIAKHIGCGNGSTWSQSDHGTNRHYRWQDGSDRCPHGFADTQNMIAASIGVGSMTGMPYS